MPPIGANREDCIEAIAEDVGTVMMLVAEPLPGETDMGEKVMVSPRTPEAESVTRH